MHMASVLSLLAFAAVAMLLRAGFATLPETARAKDPEHPAEDELAMKGLGILAVMFLAMGGALLLATNIGLIGEALTPQALAR